VHDHGLCYRLPFPSTGVNSGDTIRSAYLQLVSSDGFASTAVCGSALAPTRAPLSASTEWRRMTGLRFSGRTGDTPLDVPYTTAYTDYTTTGPGRRSRKLRGEQQRPKHLHPHHPMSPVSSMKITSRPGWTSASAMRFVLLSTDNTAPNVYAGFEDYSANHSKAARLVVNPPLPTIVVLGGVGNACAARLSDRVPYRAVCLSGSFHPPAVPGRLLQLLQPAHRPARDLR